MKFLLVFLFFGVATVSCSVASNYRQDNVFYSRNRDIVRLFYNIMMPNFYVDQHEIAKTFQLAKFYDKFTEPGIVKDFLLRFEHDFIPKDAIFTITDETYKYDAIALYKLFYYAVDYETFYRVACWARDYVNPGLFVYTLHVAVFHRPDTAGFVLPPMYQVYPYFFLNSEVIRKGLRVKAQENIYDTNLAHHYGIYKDGNEFYFYGNYTGWYTTNSVEHRLSYFTEDVGLNHYYYVFNTLFPFWYSFSNKDFMERRGEIFYYYHQQLLSRYYMERLSNGLGEIPRFSWTKPFYTGYYCDLEYSNGAKFTSRNHFYDFLTYDKYYYIDEIFDYERRLRDAVSNGFFFTKEGTPFFLKDAKDINILGNIVQGNVDSPNPMFFKPTLNYVKHVLGNTRAAYDGKHVIPGALAHYSTALRDPAFYQVFNRYFYQYFYRFKNFLKPYKRDDLIYPGISIEDVQVDKLVTFFDFFDFDMSNALYRDTDEFTQMKDKYAFYARQYRLNHKPFSVKVDFVSDKTTDVKVKFFLAPKYDSYGRLIPLKDNRINYFELDSFVYSMKTGRNSIVRNSREFFYSSKDYPKNFFDFFQKNEVTYNEFFGFPDRLVLPKGKIGGMPFRFFVMIMPLYGDKDVVTHEKSYYGVFSHAYSFKPGTLGYPFDRRIIESEFYTPNMFFRDVDIYHMEDFEMNKTYKEYYGKEFYGKKAYEKDYEYTKHPYTGEFMNHDSLKYDETFPRH